MEIKKRKNAATKPPGNYYKDVLHWEGQTIAGLFVTGFKEHTTETKRFTAYGKPIIKISRNDVAKGYCPCSPEVRRSAQIGVIKSLAAKGELVPCQHCRPTGKKAPKGTVGRKPPTGLTPLQKAVNLLQKMTTEEQQKVKALIVRHIRALRSTGAPESDPARLIIETMEVVKLEMKSPSGEMPRYEPFQQYDAYVSPIEL